jgi:beta-glucanase (GH16 family)
MKVSFVFLICCIVAINSFAQKPFKGGSGKFKHLVWSDEFNYRGLPDSNKWTMETGYIRNKELQYYTQRRMENAGVENGTLIISVLNDSLRIDDHIYPITSASLTTKGKKELTYGRIEVKTEIPSSLGTWPAIWMLGANFPKVDWPACGEIDMMEHVGFIPDTVHFTVHTAKYNHMKRNSKGARVFYPNLFNDFHVYAVEWFKDHIDWYMDDKKVFSYQDENTGIDAWPFNAPMYFLLNFAFGGEWGGARGVDITSLPQHFYIDYVRFYQ